MSDPIDNVQDDAAVLSELNAVVVRAREAAGAAAVELVRHDVGRAYLRPDGDPQRALSLGDLVAHQAVQAVRELDDAVAAHQEVCERIADRDRRRARVVEATEKLLTLVRQALPVSMSAVDEKVVRGAVQEVLVGLLP